MTKIQEKHWYTLFQRKMDLLYFLDSKQIFIFEAFNRNS